MVLVSLSLISKRLRNLDKDLAVLKVPIESKPVSGPMALKKRVLLLRIAP